MENKSSHSKARLLIAAVFVIGFAAGALSLNLYQRLTNNAAKPEPRNRTEVFIQRMDERVSLSDPQKEQVKQILDGARDRYSKIREKMEPCTKEFESQFDSARQQTRNEIRAVLTGDQLPKVEEMFKEQDGERERAQQEEKERRKK